MTSNDSQTWHKLEHDRHDIPDLFIAATVAEDSLKILVTDLGSVWSESWSKEELITRARQLKSPIDPSEDGQYDIFVGRLCSAARQRGIMISREDDTEVLHLELTAPLPKPLQPLRWTAALRREDARASSAHLMRPLLARAERLELEVFKLMEEIIAKDHVLSKLIDRLNESNTQLTDVFPGIAGRNGSRSVPSSREFMGQHVRGLAVFNEKTWVEAFEASDTVSPSMAQKEGTFTRIRPELGSSLEAYRAWYEGSGTYIISLRPNSSDDAIHEGDQTTSDTKDSVQNISNGPAKAAKSKLGVIGGRKAAPTSTTEEPAALHKPRLGVIGGKRATEHQKDSTTTPSPKETPPTKRTKLGTIGGRQQSGIGKSEAQAAPALEESRKESETTSEQAPEVSTIVSPPIKPPDQARKPGKRRRF